MPPSENNKPGDSEARFRRLLEDAALTINDLPPEIAASVREGIVATFREMADAQEAELVQALVVGDEQGAARAQGRAEGLRCALRLAIARLAVPS